MIVVNKPTMMPSEHLNFLVTKFASSCLRFQKFKLLKPVQTIPINAVFANGTCKIISFGRKLYAAVFARFWQANPRWNLYFLDQSAYTWDASDTWVDDTLNWEPSWNTCHIHPSSLSYDPAKTDRWAVSPWIFRAPMLWWWERLLKSDH